ncbi:MAG: MotA/TolQ/ExbB proton channel family protein [Armatimonadota bacterium]
MGLIARSLDILYRGGPVMVPLVLCSVVSVAVMLERFVVLRRAGGNTERLMDEMKERLSEKDFRGAISLCERTGGPIAAVLATGLRHRDLPERELERRMEETALSEIPELQRRLSWLDTIITVAPLLGLLGTVTGMISAFQVIGRSGASQPTAITGGVAEALIATATGLTIAIVTLVGYNYLGDRVKAITAEMELRATQLLNLLSALREVSPRG